MTRKGFLLCGLMVAFASGIAFGQETETPKPETPDTTLTPIPKEACSQQWCLCIIVELLQLGEGYSWYLAEHHEEYCSEEMDCTEYTVTALALPSGWEPDNCEDGGCWFGHYATALREKQNGRIASILKSKVPHDYEPKFSPNYSGKLEIIHSEFVSFVADGQEKTAKTFLVKATPTVVDNDHPVHVFSFGVEVENGTEIKPTTRVTNKKRIEKLIHGVYHVRIGGLRCGILTTDEDSGKDATAKAEKGTPTLATP